MRIALISCGKQKRRGCHPAKDLYISARFLMAMKHASGKFDKVFILSAKHGLLDPEKRIRSYDLELAQLSVEERTSWGRKVAKKINRTFIAPELTFLCGKLYYETILPHLDESYVHTPLEGLRIGQHLRWYRERLEKMT